MSRQAEQQPSGPPSDTLDQMRGDDCLEMRLRITYLADGEPPGVQELETKSAIREACASREHGSGAIGRKKFPVYRRTLAAAQQGWPWVACRRCGGPWQI